MAVIDDKVVAMSFENSKFESGVKTTLSTIDKLKASLKFENAGKGLQDINTAGKKVDLSHISRGVDEVSSRLGILRLTAIGALSNIATQAIATGTQFAKSFTIGPIIAGFQEYATNLNSIQTILANTEASGATLKDVNAALLELNHYSDKTIYNFSQMARNIGTFTAAGVELETATGAIKGIANLAALSGSNAEQASTAMYQLSQAIAAGKVNLQDWNSVVNAGMGGTVFQRALAQTAVAMGTLKEDSLKLVGPMKNVSIAGQSFRQSLAATGKDGKTWLSSDVLTKTLETFTGDLTDAQLKAEGFNDAQIKSIQQTAKTATHAATEVKTLSQVFDVAKETAGSGWSQTFQIIFGDFEEAKTTFTNLSNTINGFINTNSDARNKVLSDWKKLGGRVVLINSIKEAFRNLGESLIPIKQAFRNVFPAVTGKNLYDLTVRFKQFMEALAPSPETLQNLYRTFRGVFSLLHIGVEVVRAAFNMFKNLFQSVGVGSGGFLGFTANIGDFLTKLDETITKGKGLEKFFHSLGEVLRAPIELINAIKTALSDMFAGFNPGKFFNSIDGVTGAMTPFEKITSAVARVWDKFLNSISGSGKILRPAAEGIIHFVEGLGTLIGHAAANMNFELILQAIRTGLFGALVIMFKQFLGSGSFLSQLSQNFTGGLFKNIAAPVGSLQGAMVSLQNNLKAKTLKEIGIAIALLAGSVLLLSLVDPKKLNASLGAMTLAFGELIGAMALLTVATKTAGFVKLPFITTSLIALAAAIDLLTIAVVTMSLLSWSSLIKGLTGVGVLLGVIAAVAKPLSQGSLGMIATGAGLIAIAVGLNILALAVAQFGAMNWTELGKGLGAIAVGLGVIAAATRAMPKTLAITAAGIVVLAIGLEILEHVVEKFGRLDLKTMGKGLAGIGIALLAIAAAMHLMPLSMPVTAAGLLLVAVSLGKISDAVVKMGALSVKEIAKGLVALGGSLGILAVGLYAMSGTLAGAAALALASAGIAILVPALVKLSKLSYGQIIKGLVSLGAALGVIALGGVALSAATPAMLAFGVALILIGGGLALAGAGIFLIATGLSALAVAAPTGVGIIIAALIDLTKAIPEMAKNFVLGFLEIVKMFSAIAPKFVDALLKIIDSLVVFIIKASPKIAEAFTALLGAAIQVIEDNKDKIIQAGFDLLIALLEGIKNNIDQVTTLVADIIIAFQTSIAKNIGRIVASGFQLIVAFVKGVANNIGKIITAGFDIITKFVTSIAANVSKVVVAGLTIITKLIQGITQGLVGIAKVAGDAIIKFIKVVGDYGPKIVTAGTDAMIKFIKGLSKNSVELANAAGQAIVDFLHGLTVAINTYAPQIRTESAKLGFAIIDGMTFGLASKAQALYDKAKGIAAKTLGFLKAPWKVNSPSLVMQDLGKSIMEGMSVGMDKHSDSAYNSAKIVSNGVIDSFKKTFGIHSPSTVMIELGKFVSQGFAQGIRGSSDDIRSAFTELNDKLTQAMTTARETIASEEAKLAKLREAKKPDAAAIKQAQDVITQNQNILARSVAGHKELTKALRDEKSELITLANQYQSISTKLSLAEDALAQAQQTRRDSIKGFTDQYSTLPEIVTTDADGNAIDQLAAYEDALKHQTDAVSAYQATLQQLRKLGLDDATYQKLLAEGTADQQFATQLLSGGKTAVEGLNKLDSQLMTTSKRLAVNAGNNLYQAGVDAAQGLVNGLKSKKSAIRKEMESIAEEMIRAIRVKLGIKSPSKVFAEIGEYAMIGMAKGFSDSSYIVTQSIDKAANDALVAMRSHMSNLSSIITDELNPNPIITPILDLTQVRDKALELSRLSNSPVLAPSAIDQASRISSDQSAAEFEDPAIAAAMAPSIKYEQNNYSPESLSTLDIYRQTRNQLSQIKSALALT